MVYVSLLTNILIAAAAFAAPSPNLQSYRRRSQPIEATVSSNNSNEVYSPTWAGAVSNRYPGSFTAVTGTFVVPVPSSPGSAAVWVGIDGFSPSCNSILQTGINFTYYAGGYVSYNAWYEWYPEPPVVSNRIYVNAGDTIRLTVTATSIRSGKVVVENLSNGQTTYKFISSPYALCLQSAEWIVEDYIGGGGQLVPFTNFGTVTFTNSYARLTSGGVVTPYGATVVDLVKDGRVLTSSSESSTGVTIQYIG